MRFPSPLHAPFALGVALIVPLASALGSSAVPPLLRIAILALWLAAVIRPHAALLALALLVPFGSWMLWAIEAAPVRLTESLVIAALSGTLIAASRQPLTRLNPQRPSLGPPTLVFAGAVLSSAAVVLAVTQIGTRTPWLFIRSFTSFIAHDYLVGPPGEFVGVADAALLLEGLALAFVVARHARDGVGRPPALLRASAVAGVIAAGLLILRLLTLAGAADSVGDLVHRMLLSRTSAHVPDVNAAGSYFAMAGLVAVGLQWTVPAVLLFAAVWFTGSRVAILAAVGSLVVRAVLTAPFRRLRWPRWSLAAAAVLAAVAVGVIALGLDPRPSAARSASRMVDIRAAFMLTGLRMMASAPMFGVGIGRYFEMSGQFMPQSIYWFYFHEHAHNNFLQIAGELGLVGLAAFVGVLAAGAVRLARGLGANVQDRRLTGAIAGLSAFVATWMTSHPLLVAEVAYPFWILAGTAIARADGDAQPPFADPEASVRPPSRGPAAPSLAALLVVALVTSVPFRARSEANRLDLARQDFGFYEWEREGSHRYRWTSRRATFFVPSDARELDLPVRAIHVARNTAPTEVSIAIGGRVLHKVELPHDDWTLVRLKLPREGRQNSYRRIDILTEPAWSPAALLGVPTDVRTLGVQVGEPATRP